MPTIDEFQKTIQNLTNFKINQSEIAEILGVTRGNISQRVKNKSELKLTEAKKIIKSYNIPNPEKILNTFSKRTNIFLNEIPYMNEPEEEEMISVDYYPNVMGSCGNGTFVFSEEKMRVEIPRHIIPAYSGFKTYSIINARGGSMSPYILDKDKLIIEHWKLGQQIEDNRIYIFRFNDNIFVKRLVLNLDQIVVKSDNKEYQTRNIERSEIDNFQVIGRIVGIWREEN